MNKYRFWLFTYFYWFCLLYSISRYLAMSNSSDNDSHCTKLKIRT